MRVLKTIIIILSFMANSIGPLPSAQAQELDLPTPGVMVNLSPGFNPPSLIGVKFHPENAFQFDFIINTGDAELTKDQIREQGQKLISYFLASLATPEQEIWVNLSPYEKNRIVPFVFGQTQVGQTLLEQDYLLKQIMATALYPEKELGREFWGQVYAQAMQKFGTTDVPVNTFNKVWIVPDKASVYENARMNAVFVVESSLKVMLEKDYLAAKKHQAADADTLSSAVIRKVVIPALEKEVNEGRNFAPLRQVYQSMILAKWYKENLRKNVIAQAYVDRNKTLGVQGQDKNLTREIYRQYLKAYRKGVYNYIKEDIDPASQTMIPRKYFSGGMQFGENLRITETDAAMASQAMSRLVRGAKMVVLAAGLTLSLGVFVSSHSAQAGTFNLDTQGHVTAGTIEKNDYVIKLVTQAVEHELQLGHQTMSADAEAQMVDQIVSGHVQVVSPQGKIRANLSRVFQGDVVTFDAQALEALHGLAAQPSANGEPPPGAASPPPPSAEPPAVMPAPPAVPTLSAPPPPSGSLGLDFTLQETLNTTSVGYDKLHAELSQAQQVLAAAKEKSKQAGIEVQNQKLAVAAAQSNITTAERDTFYPGLFGDQRIISGETQLVIAQGILDAALERQAHANAELEAAQKKVAQIRQDEQAAFAAVQNERSKAAMQKLRVFVQQTVQATKIAIDKIGVFIQTTEHGNQITALGAVQNDLRTEYAQIQDAYSKIPPPQRSRALITAQRRLSSEFTAAQKNVAGLLASYQQNPLLVMSGPEWQGNWKPFYDALDNFNEVLGLQNALNDVNYQHRAFLASLYQVPLTYRILPALKKAEKVEKEQYPGLVSALNGFLQKGTSLPDDLHQRLEEYNKNLPQVNQMSKIGTVLADTEVGATDAEQLFAVLKIFPDKQTPEITQTMNDIRTNAGEIIRTALAALNTGEISNDDFNKILLLQASVQKDGEVLKQFVMALEPWKNMPLVTQVPSVDIEHVKPEVLERFRMAEYLLGQTVVVSSGYRSSAKSIEVGGFGDDAHTQGRALDTQPPPGQVQRWIEICQALGFNVIDEEATANHIHIDTTSGSFYKIDPITVVFSLIPAKPAAALAALPPAAANPNEATVPDIIGNQVSDFETQLAGLNSFLLNNGYNNLSSEFRRTTNENFGLWLGYLTKYQDYQRVAHDFKLMRELLNVINHGVGEGWPLPDAASEGSPDFHNVKPVMFTKYWELRWNLREKYPGITGLDVLSAYRDLAHQERVDPGVTGYHPYGMAFDLIPRGSMPKEQMMQIVIKEAQALHLWYKWEHQGPENPVEHVHTDARAYTADGQLKGVKIARNDQSMTATKGGIDLQNINLAARGGGVQTAFSDPVQLQLLKNSYGLMPVIYNIKAVTMPMMDTLLGNV